MLTEDNIRALVVARVIALTESANRFHAYHVDGQVRTLISVLKDGAIPPARSDTVEYLRAAGVPFSVVDDLWTVDSEWLERNLPKGYNGW